MPADREKAESTLQDLKVELGEVSEQCKQLEDDLATAHAKREKLQTAVNGLELLFADGNEPPGLAEAILTTVRQRPNQPRAAIAQLVARQTPSKSQEPLRVATVRIAQLLKEGKLIEVNGRLQIPEPTKGDSTEAKAAVPTPARANPFMFGQPKK